MPAYFNEHQRKATHRGRARSPGCRRANPQRADRRGHRLRFSRGQRREDARRGRPRRRHVRRLRRRNVRGHGRSAGSSGDSFLGGEDFTAALAARVLEGRGHVYERAEFEIAADGLADAALCEVAKRRLSRQEEVDGAQSPTPRASCPKAGRRPWCTRKQFESLDRAHPGADRSADSPRLGRRRAGARRTRRGDARRRRHAHAGLRRAARRPLSARQPQQRLNPDEVVALGAAVQAGLIAASEALEDLVVTDVAPFTLGIERQQAVRRRVPRAATCCRSSTATRRSPSAA